MPIINSLKRALTLYFLLLAFVPIFLFGLLSIQALSIHQLQGVRERNMSQAKGVAEDVRSILDEVMADLQHVEEAISSETVRRDRVDDFLASAVRNSRFFESIYLIGADYRVLYHSVLRLPQGHRDDYAGLDFSGHRLFLGGRKITSPVWSNTFVSLDTGEPSVTLGLPARQGYLLGNVRLSSLGKMLQRYAHYSGIEVAIIDNQGVPVAHNVQEMAMQRVNFGDHPTVARALEGLATTEEFDQGPRHYLESATPIHSPNWVIWVGLNMKDVLAPINNIRNLLIGFMVAAVLLASSLALLTVRRLMKPLTALGQKAGQIADGRYEFSSSPSGFAEIDHLASQISNMTQAIKVREDSIITSEQRFRDLVNSIDGIVWEMDYPSFRFLFVSKQAENMLGFPIHDWYAQESFWEMRMHPDDLAQITAYCRLMAEKQEDHDCEYRMVAADGRVVWVRNLVTVVSEANRPVRLLGVMINITDQKELLEELSSSEQNYRQIFNAASDAMFIHDAEDGRVLDVNQAMLNMFKCTYEEALGGGAASFSLGVSPYSIDEAKDKLQTAREEGYCTFEWRARRSTGALFWAEVSLRSTIIGGEARIIAVVRDISERKQAAEQLKEVNERLTLLIDRMPLACIFWSPEFTVNLWNPAAESIFGFSESEMRGKKPYGMIVPESAEPRVEQVWAKIMAGEESANSLNENVTKSGSTITCEWYSTPVHDASGGIIGVISMVHDVSARKAAEDELVKYRVHLEELVRERTEQLEVAQKELVQKERLAVLGQLTATVSHEIRNPLGTIANTLYLIKESLSSGENQHLARPLKLAERNVERCDNIISELLDFSRQRQIHKRALDVDRWLADLFAELSIPDDVERVFDFSSGATVSADDERLRRALINVVTNALQAMDETDGPEKRLEVQTRIANGRCEISVRDSGSGMSEEVLARIFEPMFSTKNFGVGLGVPIIKNIIDSHGGGVTYQSAVGTGTTVTMWLPLAESQ